ncbi:MAG: hypothetical protein AB8B96_12350 [Lysobacterales bacterium]
MEKLEKVQRAQRLLVEFLVIVSGVFIAVAAESWWSEREDRSLEREVRHDMAEEFASNIQILEQDIAANDRWQPIIDGLTELSDEQLLAISDQELNRQYGRITDWAGFDAEMGIAQALVTSGNIGSISDSTLRLRLSRWAGLMVEKDRKTLQATQFQHNALMPVVAEVTADAKWDVAERRQIQTLYSTFSLLHQITLHNQRLMLEEARGIHAYLKEIE